MFNAINNYPSTQFFSTPVRAGMGGVELLTAGNSKQHKQQFTPSF
jgi:hypothetical protein